MAVAPEGLTWPQQNGDGLRSGSSVPAERQIVTDVSSSGDEVNVKVRKPYTITKQRERWSEDEHRKFLEALKLYGRAWRKIEEHIGSKTAVQIRSHAQKFFSKIERGVPAGNLAAEVEDINIPPPRPKRKPSHPYPKKAGYNPSIASGHLGTSSSSGTVTAESIELKTSIDDEGGAELAHDSPVTKAYGSSSPQGDVKLFGKTVTIPTVPSLINLRKISVEEDTADVHCNKGNWSRNRSSLPSLKVQRDVSLAVTKDTIPLHTNANNLGTTTVEGTDESVVEASTNGTTKVEESSAAVDSYRATNDNLTILNELQDANQVDDSKVDAEKCPGLQFPKPDHQTNAMYLWITNLFHFYSRLLASQYATHGSVEENSINPIALWHLMQASNMGHPFPSTGAMAAGLDKWSGLVAGSQGTSHTSNELCSFPFYVDGVPLPQWWDPRGFVPSSQQCSSINNNSETDVGNSVKVYRTQPINSADCIKMSEQKLQVGRMEMSSGITTPTGAEFSERIQCMENGDKEYMVVMSDQTIQEASSQPPARERESEKNQDQHSVCSLLDEPEEGEKRSRNGSSSGSNAPLDDCQLSEAGTGNDPEPNNASNAEKNYSELESTTDGSPKIRFKYIEKRKRNQQADCNHKHVSNEESKRAKGSGHEVSEQCRKAFQALFTRKTLPQKFPIAANKSVERPWTCRIEGANDKEGSQEGEEMSREVKFNVSSRSGFIPYRQAIKVNCSV